MNGRTLAGVFVIVLVAMSMVPVTSSSANVSPPDHGESRSPDVYLSAEAADSSGKSLNGMYDLASQTCGSYSQSYPEDPVAFIVETDTAGNESMYQEYGELATIQSLAKSKLQIGRFTDEKETEMRLVLDLLHTFSESYRLAQNGSIESSLSTAERADSCIASFQDRGIEYGSLASIALDRFYRNRGQELQNQANQVERTSERIGRLELAATAYRRGGATQRFSQTTLRAERLRTEYRRELKVMNTSAEAANRFANRCFNCDDPISALRTHNLDVFSLYVRAKQAQTTVTEAHSLAGEHGLSERRQRYASLSDRIETARFSLAVASTAIVEAYALIIAVVAMFVSHRISAWRETVENSRIGDVVLRGGDLQ